MTNEICPHCQLPRQGAHSCMDSMRAAIEQLHAALKTAQELAATRLIVIERLHDVIDSRDRALGFVPLDEVHASEPLPVASRDADHCDYPDCEQHWTHVVAQARALLEPLADCDPAIRQWLKTPDLPKLPGASRDASSGLLANHCSCGSCVWGLSATASMTSADGSVHRFNKPCTLRTSE